MATIASDGSLANIQSIYNAGTTNAGDIITIPSGSFNWGSGALSLTTKAITILGANGLPPTGPSGYGTGTINTTITGTGSPMIQVTNTTSGQKRLSGFRLAGSSSVFVLKVDGSSGESINDGIYRLDNIDFSNSGSQFIIQTFGNGPGLIDHCKLTHGAGSEMIHNTGTFQSGQTGVAGDGWTVDVNPGSNQALYIENCWFFNNSTTTVASGIQTYYGGRTVVRNNQWTFCGPDNHGGAQNGTRWFESYNNLFVVPAGLSLANPGPGNMRAGSGFIFNNHVSLGAGSSIDAFQIYADTNTGINNTYPPLWGPCFGLAIDLVNDSSGKHPSPIYLWGNDSPIQPPGNNGATNFILNRDFFFSATQPPPAGQAGAIKLWQRASDTANTTFTYTPFTYPYPLVNGLPSATGGGPTNINATVSTIAKAVPGVHCNSRVIKDASVNI